MFGAPQSMPWPNNKRDFNTVSYVRCKRMLSSLLFHLRLFKIDASCHFLQPVDDLSDSLKTHVEHTCYFLLCTKLKGSPMKNH
jgi:hypothetical protein